MKCPKCHQKNEKGLKFCTSCGAPLKRSHKKPLTVLTVLFVLLLTGNLLVTVLHRKWSLLPGIYTGMSEKTFEKTIQKSYPELAPADGVFRYNDVDIRSRTTGNVPYQFYLSEQDSFPSLGIDHPTNISFRFLNGKLCDVCIAAFWDYDEVTEDPECAYKYAENKVRPVLQGRFPDLDFSWEGFNTFGQSNVRSFLQGIAGSPEFGVAPIRDIFDPYSEIYGSKLSEYYIFSDEFIETTWPNYENGIEPYVIFLANSSYYGMPIKYKFQNIAESVSELFH